MSVALHSDPVALRVDEHGAIRIGRTRVLFDLVVRAFEDGATPEMIVQMYSTLSLADTYSAIAYYLRHKEEIQEYLRRRDVEADELRARIEASQPSMAEIRQRLFARREELSGRAPAAQ